MSLAPTLNASSLSYKYFGALLFDNDVAASEDELLVYAETELDLKIKAFPEKLKESLPAILVAFMQKWPGWDHRGRCEQAKVSREHYFVEFNKYMINKTHVLFEKQWQMVQAILDECEAEAVNGMETPPPPPPAKASNEDGSKADDHDLRFAPFAIKVQCPPAMLNTLVFDSAKDDVLLNQHLGGKWEPLTQVQLLNWPFIEVRFRNADMHFVRTQTTEFLRYLNVMKHKSPKFETHVVEQAQLLRNGIEAECYTVRYVQEYLREYLTLLKNKHLDPRIIEEYHILLVQLLDDIKLMNVNQSIVTNTRIKFKLSAVPYIRNKKLVKDRNANNDTRVGYCEVITPKVDLILLKFSAEQVESDLSKVSFVSIEQMRDMPLKDIIPKLLYRCTFCDVQYTRRTLIMQHLKDEHRMESHVRCTICKKQFDVMNLAGCRWRHKCTTVMNPVAALNTKRHDDTPIVIDE